MFINILRDSNFSNKSIQMRKQNDRNRNNQIDSLPSIVIVKYFEK